MFIINELRYFCGKKRKEKVSQIMRDLSVYTIINFYNKTKSTKKNSTSKRNFV